MHSRTSEFLASLSRSLRSPDLRLVGLVGLACHLVVIAYAVHETRDPLAIGAIAASGVLCTHYAHSAHRRA